MLALPLVLALWLGGARAYLPPHLYYYAGTMPPDVTDTATPAELTTNLTTVPTTRSATAAPERFRYVAQVYAAGFMSARPELCPQHGRHLLAIVLAASAPERHEQRRAVRDTYKTVLAVTDNVAFAFVVGSVDDVDAMQALEEEGDNHGDMIIGNSIDSYRNLTLKTLSMLEWVVTHCAHAPLVLKVEDDVFVNVPALVAFAESHRGQIRTIWGDVRAGRRPVRARASRHYLSLAEYPYTFFPKFVSGAAYILSGDVVNPLLQVAGYERYIPFEEVLFTGVLASKMGIRRRHAGALAGSRRCYMRRRLAGRVTLALECVARDELARHLRPLLARARGQHAPRAVKLTLPYLL